MFVDLVLAAIGAGASKINSLYLVADAFPGLQGKEVAQQQGDHVRFQSAPKVGLGAGAARGR